ncbi:Insulin-like receptor [Acropora cervicornis]|uniref:Insulin-like receptor n=1 Tax=Acropora cervicornis TaxID=6130 RepID=A0AAD9UWP1_ACRCE|nr:Insulin-like receptor [Acropora cervicornis]
MITELCVMKRLKSHNHVVQMIGYSTRGDPLLLILEYMPSGDLLGYLRISRGHHDARLPVEWMPRESLFLGESSTKSDVYVINISISIMQWLSNYHFQ